MAQLEITNIPTYVNGREFERLFTELPNCVSCHLETHNGRKVGMVHFVDQNSAALAISLYKGSECWGTPGLDMNLRPANFGGSNSNKRPFSAVGAQRAQHDQPKQQDRRGTGLRGAPPQDGENGPFKAARTHDRSDAGDWRGPGDRGTSHGGFPRQQGRGPVQQPQQAVQQQQQQQQQYNDRVEEYSPQPMPQEQPLARGDQMLLPRDQMGPPRDQSAPMRDHLGPPREQLGGQRDQMGIPQEQFLGPRNQGQMPREQLLPVREHTGGPREQMGIPREQLGPVRDQMGGPREQAGIPREQQLMPLGVDPGLLESLSGHLANLPSGQAAGGSMPMHDHMGGPSMMANIPQGVSGPMGGNPGGNPDARFVNRPQGEAMMMRGPGQEQYNGPVMQQGTGYPDGFQGQDPEASRQQQQQQQQQQQPDLPGRRMLQSWQDEVTPSISVGNLPADITKRELAHIFRPFLGFLEARVVRFETRGGNMKVMGYAEFDVPKSAENAMSLVKGYVLDLEDPQSILHFGYFKTREDKAPQQAAHLDRHRTQGQPQQPAEVIPYSPRSSAPPGQQAQPVQEAPRDPQRHTQHNNNGPRPHSHQGPDPRDARQPSRDQPRGRSQDLQHRPPPRRQSREGGMEPPGSGPGPRRIPQGGRGGPSGPSGAMEQLGGGPGRGPFPRQPSGYPEDGMRRSNVASPDPRHRSHGGSMMGPPRERRAPDPSPARDRGGPRGDPRGDPRGRGLVQPRPGRGFARGQGPRR